MQERLLRLRVGEGELAGTRWGLEQILVKVAFLFQSFHAAAQIGDRVTDAAKLLGVHLEGFTGERKWPPPPRNDSADGGDEDQRDDELKNTHARTLSAIRGYCTDEVC